MISCTFSAIALSDEHCTNTGHSCEKSRHCVFRTHQNVPKMDRTSTTYNQNRIHINSIIECEVEVVSILAGRSTEFWTSSQGNHGSSLLLQWKTLLAEIRWLYMERQASKKKDVRRSTGTCANLDPRGPPIQRWNLGEIFATEHSVRLARLWEVE